MLTQTAVSSGADLGPYVAALIAVTGTLLGTALANFSASRRAERDRTERARHQQVQLEHESMEANREDRRHVYAAFFDTQRQWADLLVEIADAFFVARRKAGGRESGDVTLDPDVRAALRAREKALHERWSAELSRVQLIGSDRVSDLAFIHFSNYCWRINRAWRGENPMRGNPPGGELYPVTLLEAMQRDIGITDGVQVNPTTGARVLRDHRPPGVPEPPCDEGPEDPRP